MILKGGWDLTEGGGLSLSAQHKLGSGNEDVTCASLFLTASFPPGVSAILGYFWCNV